METDKETVVKWAYAKVDTKDHKNYKNKERNGSNRNLIHISCLCLPFPTSNIFHFCRQQRLVIRVLKKYKLL